MSALIVGLWVAGLVAKAALLRRLLARGMGRRYPVLCGALAYSAMRSALCLGGLALGGWASYRMLWPATRPPEVLLSAAVSVEVLYAMARHYPEPWRVVALVAAPFGLLGAAAGAGVATLPLGAVQLAGALALGRWVYMALSVLVVSSGAALRWVEPRMRMNVVRYAGGAAVCLAAAAAGQALMAVGGYWWVAAGQVISAAVPLWGLRMWAGMDQKGEWHAPSRVIALGVGAGK